MLTPVCMATSFFTWHIYLCNPTAFLIRLSQYNYYTTVKIFLLFMNTHPNTIAIVDDHAVIRKAVSFRLSIAGYKVIIEAENGQHFLEQLRYNTTPDICLLDINMPVMNGFETLVQLRKSWPGMKVVFFSMQNDKSYIDRAMQSGADGYVTKDAPLEELDNALRRLTQGKREWMMVQV